MLATPRVYFDFVYPAEKTNSDEDLGTYRRHKNKLKSMVCQAKVDYLRSSISRTRSSPRMAAQMWSHINSVIGRPYQKQAGVTPLASLDSINEFFPQFLTAMKLLVSFL